MSARRVVAVVGVLMTVLLAGCGLSTDDAPEAIAGGSVESSASAAPSTLVPASDDTADVSVWFVHTDDAGSVLWEVQRQAPLPVTAGGRLDALLGQPPSASERENGLWSALPPDATLASRPRRRGEVLVVDFPEAVYDDLHGIIAQNAFAQIVYTATEIPGVDSVTFERDGAVFEAVDGQGQARAKPLGRDDFGELSPLGG